MKLTIIPADNFVSIDGVSKYMNIALDSNITSVQWDNNRGTVGLKVGGSRSIESLSEFQQIINNFNSPVTSPVISLAELKKQKISALAEYRYKKETGGFLLNGLFVSTDDRAKTLLIGARIEAVEAIENNQSYSINWKTENGFITLDATTIISISNVVRAFVQGCFDKEKTHTENIQSLGIVAQVEQYDFKTGWD